MTVNGAARQVERRSWFFIPMLAGIVAVAIAAWLTFDRWPLVAQDDQAANNLVLHFQAIRHQDESVGGEETIIEGWFDQATWEGKIQETTGSQVTTTSLNLDEGLYVQYVQDGDYAHAVVRHGAGEESPFLAVIHDPIFGARDAIENGTAATLGMVEDAEVDGQQTTRITITSPDDGDTEVTDIAKETGLVLRFELISASQQSFVQKTTYQLIEERPRAEFSDTAFTTEIPPNANREDYFEGDAFDANDIDRYVVYVTPSLGSVETAFRYQSRTFELETDKAVYIYATDNGKVTVTSSLPLSEAAFEEITQSPPHEPLEISGVTWWVTDIAYTQNETHAITQIEETLVKIFAPNLELFNEAAVALQPLSER